VSEQLLNILKICLLALLYLFFLRVLRAVWAEMNAPKAGEVDSGRRGRRAAAPAVAAPAPGRGGRRRRGTPSSLVVVEPADHQGEHYPLGDELTVGRAAGCQVTVDDTYVSQLHARVFSRDGQHFVEDLGSTNGTYLNRTKVSGPMPLQRGDRLQVGNTILEVT
jgi:hypothetical protein